ncbi:dual 3',5'-cyclic-AMP and -GMP phosphodiesterase 11A-like isoform X2 [Ruditapes philippinarum]|uniref:dual 3',5'-cyclic-AMP and -GMP phosphodiesterase 11A-like isoform X2 n=1 Tax=Ruditapes philippinarum TaxID=129788 RepID=UPI00295ADB3C|nr:dual 3',5'-cyclic-AMP and -GMP phosphodiesterase 11A-like isoform X2 [Ruditapes philippinarum]
MVTMTGILVPNYRQVDVESWFDQKPEAMEEIFLRKADINLINKWLIRNGYSPATTEIVMPKRGSGSDDNNSDPTSPIDARGDVFFAKHGRSNSKKYLRHDFAKSKYRNMFRTYEPSAMSEQSADDRRINLKEMRMFRSLPPNSSNILSLLIQSKVRLPRYPSKDIDRKREERHTNEMEFFMDIVKDISNDLNLKSLSEKMVANISVLSDADHASVFFVEGKRSNKQSLVSKIFDVHSGTQIMPTKTSDNSIRVPWGKGIMGYVAEHREIVNLSEAFKDPRYNDEVDRITGYTTDSLLCMPVKNSDDEIVAVAQVINKSNGEGFTKEDEKLLSAYLSYCGIAIYNAQIFDAYSKEYERNKCLLEVVHDLFEEQTSLDDVILKIMQRAQTLLKCERCSVLLKDSNSEKPFSKVFDLAYPLTNGTSCHSAIRRRQQFSRGKVETVSPRNRSHSAPCCTYTSSDPCADLQLGNKLAELVLKTEETINISDAHSDPRFDRETDVVSGYHTKSILCKPIRNRYGQIIGVAEIVNRIDGLPFDEHDEQLFEAFTIFCGLGINNAQLYEEVAISSAKQTVALEVLSYHAGIENVEVEKIKNKHVPPAPEWRLNELTFNDFSLNNDEMVMAGLRIFKDLGLAKSCRIDFETLCKFLLTVKKNYRNVAYHNWRHAFNVCQLMFSALLKCNLRRLLSKLECLALIVGCLCHDLDHRGTNNAFQEKTSSALALLYGTKTTLEHHHFNHAIMILNTESTNIFSNLSSDEYSKVINILKHAILATDLSLHIQVREKWFAMVDEGRIDWDDKDLREIFRSILMTTCDIGAITKPWDVSRKVADLVMTEFFDQGDKEKSELKIQPQAHMDREKQDQLPALQLGWIDGICRPLYESLAKFDKSFKPMLNGVLLNRAEWEYLDAERLSKQGTSRESVV